jgi:HK97 family phage portal protein
MNGYSIVSDPTLTVSPELAARIYQTSPLVNTLIRIGADAFKTLPLNIMVQERGADGESKPKTSGPVVDLLSWVNPRMVRSELMANLYSWMKLVGQAFWAIVPSDPQYAKEHPLSIYPLNPIYVRIVPDPETGVRNYIYQIGSIRIFLEDDQVIHFRTFNPHNYWLGNLDLNTLEFDIQIERYSKKQIRNYHANAAVLSGVLSSEEEVGDTEIKRLKKEFYSQNAGARNAYRILVLEKGMKYEPLQANATDQFIDSLLGSVSKSHSMVLGVPLGLASGLAEDLPRSDIIAIEAIMWKQNLLPFAQYVAEVITKFICQKASKQLFCIFDHSNVEALRIHELDRIRGEVAQILAGDVTPNEVRIGRNRKPYADLGSEFAALSDALGLKPELLDQLMNFFGQVPTPVFNAMMAQAGVQQKLQASPSMGLPGSMGGRDQSTNGEAQMADPTGTRSIFDADADIYEKMARILGS